MTEPTPSQGDPKVLVVGSNPILRHGIAEYFRLMGLSTAIREASPADSLASVPAANWTLIVLDLEGTPDLGILPVLRATVPTIPVLVLKIRGRGANAQCILAGGATGCLTKDSPAAVWTQAFKAVAGGGTYCPFEAD
jgi:DNA-binding NarL/FixJ family response regulator